MNILEYGKILKRFKFELSFTWENWNHFSLSIAEIKET